MKPLKKEKKEVTKRKIKEIDFILLFGLKIKFSSLSQHFFSSTESRRFKFWLKTIICYCMCCTRREITVSAEPGSKDLSHQDSGRDEKRSEKTQGKISNRDSLHCKPVL